MLRQMLPLDLKRSDPADSDGLLCAFWNQEPSRSVFVATSGAVVVSTGHHPPLQDPMVVLRCF